MQPYFVQKTISAENITLYESETNIRNIIILITGYRWYMLIIPTNKIVRARQFLSANEDIVFYSNAPIMWELKLLFSIGLL